MKNNPPIFIHSLFRSGSTYIFNVFRRSKAGYWCYQEPIHELVLLAKEKPEELLTYSGDKMKALRHPPIDKSYFWELYEVYSAWKDILDNEIIYDTYFDNKGCANLVNYLNALISSARGRTVIQECRTSNRIATIKNILDGTHIYLWRNPWDQWWSYKVDEYFELKNLLILNASSCPEIIARLRNEIGFEKFDNKDIFAGFNFFVERRLSTSKSYMVFYTLWCLALIEGISSADVLINIDTLSDNPGYRQSIINELERFNVNELDFSDCKVPQTYYSKKEIIFFEEIENNVYKMLISSGYSQKIIDNIFATRYEHKPLLWKKNLQEVSGEILFNAEKARENILIIEQREPFLVTNLKKENLELNNKLKKIIDIFDSEWELTPEINFLLKDIKTSLLTNIKKTDLSNNISNENEVTIYEFKHKQELFESEKIKNEHILKQLYLLRNILSSVSLKLNDNIELKPVLEEISSLIKKYHEEGLQRENIIQTLSNELFIKDKKNELLNIKIQKLKKELDYERSQHDIIKSYHNRLEMELNQLNQSLSDKDIIISEEKNKNINIEEKLVSSLQNINKLENQSKEYESKINELNQKIELIHKSYSWRLTYPLRLILDILTGRNKINNESLQLFFNKLKSPFIALLISIIQFFVKNPAIGDRTAIFLSRFPKTYKILRNLAIKNGLIKDLPDDEDHDEQKFITDNQINLSCLNPRARKIYYSLIKEKNNKKEDI